MGSGSAVRALLDMVALSFSVDGFHWKGRCRNMARRPANRRAGKMNIGGIIATPGHTQERLYIIEGIHLGALNQEDLIEISVIDRSTPHAHGEQQGIFVPKEMLEMAIKANLFTYTQP
jgi:hypothetical protein